MQLHTTRANEISSHKGNNPNVIDSVSQKHNTAITSRETFTIIKNTGQIQREKEIVLEAIKKNQPVTSRSLSRITGIERTNITRSLFDLVHDKPPLIKEAYIDKCQVTQKRVKYYALIEWPQILLFKDL